MAQIIKNYTEDIHNDTYYKQYLSPEYTCKDMIYDCGRTKESLDGQWHFSTDQYDYCLRGKWYEEKYFDENGLSLPVDYDFDGWDTIQVPGVWNTQKKEYFYYEGPGVYTRTFIYKNHGEKKVILKCGAVYYSAKVFLNKKFIGYHKGGSTPFYIDVTPYIQEQNRIIIVADNTRRTTQVPSINTDWFNYGGITRSVELIRLPESYIQDFTIRLQKGSTNILEGSVTVAGNTSIATAQVAIPELSLTIQVPLEKKDDNLKSGTFTCKADLSLWSPENPKLYDVTVTADSDTVHDEIGFRSIEVKGNNIYLNGKAIYLNGISAHEESVPHGKAADKEEIIANFTLAKELNCNFMRLAHYPHNELAAKLADKMGLLLWEEIPVYWLLDFDNPDTYADAQNQLSELITRDKNRCSVIIWSVGNENPDTDSRLSFMSRLAQHAHTQDPCRLVSAACLVDTVNLKIADRLEQYLDVIGLNEYYGWYNPDFQKLNTLMQNSQPTKPVIITEFGADALSGAYGTIDEKGTETYQEYVYKKQTALIGTIPYIKGTTPWILFDFRTPRRMSKYQHGYNTKGLLSADKTHKKLAFYVLQAFYKNRGTQAE
ncbi:MAG: hypothetical protein K6E51_05175 [Treponema sp.]|nr:hypothetical protein [Treponema sp.]